MRCLVVARGASSFGIDSLPSLDGNRRLGSEAQDLLRWDFITRVAMNGTKCDRYALSGRWDLHLDDPDHWAITTSGEHVCEDLN